MFDGIAQLVAQCAPAIHPQTMAALVQVESRGNPFAIALVPGRLERQPKSLAEAVSTANALLGAGIKFSAGVGQIYVANWQAQGLDAISVFDPCRNLAASQAILQACFVRASSSVGATANDQLAQVALGKALSCYYSGNFKTGFSHGYVARVVRAASSSPERLGSAREGN